MIENLFCHVSNRPNTAAGRALCKDGLLARLAESTETLDADLPKGALVAPFQGDMAPRQDRTKYGWSGSGTNLLKTALGPAVGKFQGDARNEAEFQRWKSSSKRKKNATEK